MRPTIRLSFGENEVIVTLDYGFKQVEGFGETISEALYDLAGAVEMDGNITSYLMDVTGVPI